MNEIISKWLYGPAKWYQFWRPRSGVIGGCIFGFVVVLLVVVLVETLVL